MVARGLLLTPYIPSANILSTKRVLAQVRDQLARYAGRAERARVARAFTVGVLGPRASSMVMSRPALDCGWYQRLRAGTDDSPAAAG